MSREDKIDALNFALRINDSLTLGESLAQSTTEVLASAKKIESYIKGPRARSAPAIPAGTQRFGQP